MQVYTIIIMLSIVFTAVRALLLLPGMGSASVLLGVVHPGRSDNSGRAQMASIWNPGYLPPVLLRNSTLNGAALIHTLCG